MIRVLLVDDEALVRDGLRSIAELAGDLEIVGEAADGAAAIALVDQVRPDVVLIDIRMPGMDGLEATERILAGADPPKVLVLTTFDHNEYLYRAMRAGASGFLLKDVRRGELADAVRAAYAGQRLVAPSITLRLIERFCAAGPPLAPADRLATLTDREREVLVLLGRGLTNAEIAADLVVAETTAKTHVARILAKLGLRDRTQAAIVAYETGLAVPGAPNNPAG